MKDKNIAGVLALFLGAFGVHRFYLGQVGLGILYAMFVATGVSMVLGVIDAIVFFSMDQDSFDIKYNRNYYRAARRRETDFDRKGKPESRQDYRENRQKQRPERKAPDTSRVPQRSKAQAEMAAKAAEFKKTGIAKYKDYDFDGAIEDFVKALQITGDDVAIHFNLACAYSLTEQADKAFNHLDQAVGLGFNDFQRIKTHDALAFLRIQPEFEEFERRGFRVVRQIEAAKPENDLLQQITNTDLLLQLKKLEELKEKGLLTEEEYDYQRRKLTE